MYWTGNARRQCKQNQNCLSEVDDFKLISYLVDMQLLNLTKNQQTEYSHAVREGRKIIVHNYGGEEWEG